MEDHSGGWHSCVQSDHSSVAREESLPSLGTVLGFVLARVFRLPAVCWSVEQHYSSYLFHFFYHLHC